MSWSKEDTKALAIGGGVLGGAALLYFLVAGLRPEKNSALIPDVIEERLDMLVLALDRRFGKDWVNRGVSVLKTVLESALPPPVTALVDVVVAAERVGRSNGWSGREKRSWAAQQARA